MPQSDVVVAQNRTSLCIWYNIEMSDNASMIPIRGEITGIARNNGKSEVLVQTGIETTSYTLDEGLVEFGTGMIIVHVHVRYMYTIVHTCTCISSSYSSP